MIKYSLIHNRKGKLSSDGTALIQIRAYDGHYRKCKFLSTGIKIVPKQWDKSLQKINHHNGQYITLNRILDDKVKELQDYEISMIGRGKDCTVEMLEQFSAHGKSRMLFNDFVDYELKNATLRQSTIKQQTVFLHKLNEYNPSVPFTQIDYDFCTKFHKFLVDKGLGKNSIAKEFKNFKKFVNLAIKKGHFDKGRNPFPDFKVKTTPSKKVFLTDDEIKRIEELDLNHDPDVDRIRDMYLLGVYTGLRFSDICNLAKRDIKVDVKGEWNLYIRMEKTEDLISLPLHKLFGGKPRDLLMKYSHGSGPNYFNNYTNQYVNRMLKVIARMVRLDKPLTFHSSRHSFGTSLLNRGIRIETVQRLMGHRKLQQTQEYAKLLNTTVVKELDQVW